MIQSDEQSSLAQARAFEQAGNACVYESSIEEATVNYGWAIDGFLDAGAFEEAIRICRKLIRISPGVVRTRYTLLFLLVGLRREEEARAALDDYVRLVIASGTRSFAVPRLQLLAYATDDAETTARIERVLEDLGEASQGVGAHLASEHLAADPLAGAERVERWEKLLPIALRDD